MRQRLLRQEHPEVVFESALNDVRDGQLHRLGRRLSLRNTAGERTVRRQLAYRRTSALGRNGRSHEQKRSDKKETCRGVTNHSTVAPQKD